MKGGKEERALSTEELSCEEESRVITLRLSED